MRRVRCATTNACRTRTARAQTNCHAGTGVSYASMACPQNRPDVTVLVGRKTPSYLLTYVLTYLLTCPQNRQTWCGTMKPGTEQSSSDRISEQQAALHYIYQPCWSPGGRRSVREDNPDKSRLTGAMLTEAVFAVQEQC